MAGSLLARDASLLQSHELFRLSAFPVIGSDIFNFFLIKGNATKRGKFQTSFLLSSKLSRTQENQAFRYLHGGESGKI
jgi:hypothetical protein